MIFPIIIAVSLLGTYRKLGHVKEQIASLDRQQVKTAKQLNRKLLRAKPALDPDLIPSVGNTCRIKIMGDEAFFVQRGAARPFVAERENVRDALVNAEAAKLCLRFEHPLGKLKYTFSKANSQKLRGWLDDVPPTAPPPEG